jgi:hypothetical protein
MTDNFPVDSVVVETSSSFLVDTILRWSLRIGSVVVGLVAVVGSLLYAKQDSLLYFPTIGNLPRKSSDNPRGYRSPGERQIPYRDCDILCSDGVHIHAWFLPYDDKDAPILIFFHGNAGNIGLRLPNAIQMRSRLACNLLMVEYRGYGESDNVPPNEAGLKLDAQAGKL